MKDVKELLELFKDEIPQPEDLRDKMWKWDFSDVSYNGENNLEDFENGDGDTYTLERSNGWEKDGVLLFEFYDGCGGVGQAFFSLDKEIK